MDCERLHPWPHRLREPKHHRLLAGCVSSSLTFFLCFPSFHPPPPPSPPSTPPLLALSLSLLLLLLLALSLFLSSFSFSCFISASLQLSSSSPSAYCPVLLVMLCVQMTPGRTGAHHQADNPSAVTMTSEAPLRKAITVWTMCVPPRVRACVFVCARVCLLVHFTLDPMRDFKMCFPSTFLKWYLSMFRYLTAYFLSMCL